MCKAISRRAAELELLTLSDYRRYLLDNPDEWHCLDAIADVTISRFYRDRSVFDFVQSEVFPALIESAHEAGRPAIRVWSSGCANGEEPYTVALIWEFVVSPIAGDTRLHILGTDTKQAVLNRAGDARYPQSSLRDLPPAWRETAFYREGENAVLKPGYQRSVTFARHDIRDELDGMDHQKFDLVLCRYQAFTYFDSAGQESAATALARVTRSGAVLVLGRREHLAAGDDRFRSVAQSLSIYERI